MNRVGVLALQGAVSEHLGALRTIGVEAEEVRYPEQVERLDGLILPGGESTTLEKLMRRFEFDQALEVGIERGLAVWGTCAGLILLAQEITSAIEGQRGFSHLPVRVQRNAFGRQLESCEVPVDMPILQGGSFPAVFIRAPGITKCLATEVEILGQHQGMIVAVRWKRMLATSFHPELTDDVRLHRYFLEQVMGIKKDREDGEPTRNFQGSVH